MGTTMGSLIQVREDLTRKRGDTIVFPTVRRLVGAGVTGNTVLEGNEEVLNARSLNLSVAAIPPRRRRLGLGRAEVGDRTARRRPRCADELVAGKAARRTISSSRWRSVTADGSVQIPFSTTPPPPSAITGWSTMPTGCCSACQSQTLRLRRHGYRLLADPGRAHRQVMLRAPPSSPWPSVSPGPRTRTSGPISVNDDEEWFVMFMPQPAVPRSDAGPGHHQRPAIRLGARQEITRCSLPATSCGAASSSRKCRKMPVIAGAGAAGIERGHVRHCAARRRSSALHGRKEDRKVRANTRTMGYAWCGPARNERYWQSSSDLGVDPTVDTTKPVDAGVVSVFTSAVADA